MNILISAVSTTATAIANNPVAMRYISGYVLLQTPLVRNIAKSVAITTGIVVRDAVICSIYKNIYTKTTHETMNSNKEDKHKINYVLSIGNTNMNNSLPETVVVHFEFTMDSPNSVKGNISELASSYLTEKETKRIFSSMKDVVRTSIAKLQKKKVAIYESVTVDYKPTVTICQRDARNYKLVIDTRQLPESIIMQNYNVHFRVVKKKQPHWGFFEKDVPQIEDRDEDKSFFTSMKSIADKAPLTNEYDNIKREFENKMTTFYKKWKTESITTTDIHKTYNVTIPFESDIVGLFDKRHDVTISVTCDFTDAPVM